MELDLQRPRPTQPEFADVVPSLSGVLTRAVSRSIPMNLVITNIPGPPVPLYLLGAPIKRAYPYVEVIDHDVGTVLVQSFCLIGAVDAYHTAEARGSQRLHA